MQKVTKAGRSEVAFLVRLMAKVSAHSAYLAISFLIMLVYILRRRAGHEGKIENGHVSDAELFWVSGILDGLIAIAGFSALYWALIVVRRRRLRKAKKSKDDTLSDTFG